MLKKVWNYRISGLMSALIIICNILILKLKNILTSYLFTQNINKCGKDVKIMKGVIYRFPNNIEIGNNIIVGENTVFSTEETTNKYLKIEDGTSIGMKCHLDFSGGLTIRKNVHIAHNVLLSTHDHGYNYKNPPIGKSLEIKENAFIGSNSIIMHNVRVIGCNAVVGTGSVVTKEVPDNAIVAGNPAKVVKYT